MLSLISIEGKQHHIQLQGLYSKWQGKERHELEMMQIQKHKKKKIKCQTK
ncbi:hypothetical protein DsansV1_C26g0196311 [Dioscorea sansibarensis]